MTEKQMKDLFKRVMNGEPEALEEYAKLHGLLKPIEKEEDK
ncbi:hypothetical protein [Cytobacillus firmus]|nr:hypothetical protein [Cytobacillus firmus]